MPTETRVKQIGLIAGNSRFPLLCAKYMKREGYRVAAVALKEETEQDIEKYADKVKWINVGKLQQLIDFFKQENISEVIMAGQVKHTKLFSDVKLDLRAVKLLATLANKKADSILGAIADELAKEGIKMLASHQFLSHLLAHKGIISGKKPSKEEQKDIEFGHHIAKQIAGLDIGQTVCVKDKCVLAVESIEGTNACIKRGASLGKENIVVVKVAKPNQDYRFDIPVIGPDTIKTMCEVKARVLAVEAGSTLIIDKEDMLEKAKQGNITVIGI